MNNESKYKDVIQRTESDIDFISKKNIKKSKDRGEALVDESLLKDFQIKVIGSMDNILKKKNEFGEVVVAIHSDILVDFFCDRKQLKEKIEKINNGSKEEKFNSILEERQKLEEEEIKLKIAEIKGNLNNEQAQRLEKIKQIKGAM